MPRHDRMLLIAASLVAILYIISIIFNRMPLASHQVRHASPSRQLPTVYVSSSVRAAPRFPALCEGGASSGRQPAFWQRFCERGAKICARIHSELDRYADELAGGSLQGMPPVVHLEGRVHGAGYGHVVQEHAGVLMMGVLLRRSVAFHSAPGTFNHRWSLLRPPDPLASLTLVRPTVNSSLEDCEGRVARLGARLPYQCVNLGAVEGVAESVKAAMAATEREPASFEAAPGSGEREWLCALKDGSVHDFFSNVSEIWDPWRHLKVSIPRGQLFPEAPIGFVSPSIAAMHLGDFLEAQKAGDDLSGQGWHTGRGEGAPCLLRYLAAHVAAQVKESVLETFGVSGALGAIRPEGAALGSVVVGVHLRRGDGAMGKECHGCVSRHEPDVTNPVLGYRLTLEELDTGLRCIGHVVTTLRRELGQPVTVFVSSDTSHALERAKALLQVNGTLVVSTQGRAVHTKAEEMPLSSAVKLAADYLSFGLADVHFALGQSSLSSNAAQMGLGTIRRTGWDNVCRAVQPDEIRSLRRTLEENA